MIFSLLLSDTIHSFWSVASLMSPSNLTHTWHPRRYWLFFFALFVTWTKLNYVALLTKKMCHLVCNNILNHFCRPSIHLFILFRLSNLGRVVGERRAKRWTGCQSVVGLTEGQNWKNMQTPHEKTSVRWWIQWNVFISFHFML